MILRSLFVATAAAVALPLLGGTASASCLDDANARRLDEGYTQSPKSQYWSLGYVTYDGAATVVVYGDAALADWSSHVREDVPELTAFAVANSVDIAGDFVTCVAG